MKPFVIFNGLKYSLDKSNGYFRSHGPYVKRKNPKTYLHRDMWIAAYGPIPKGYDVHHKDEDKSHNELSNFECLMKSRHQWKYSAVRKQTPVIECAHCGSIILRRDSSGASIAPIHYRKRIYCSSRCFGLSQRGKPNSAAGNISREHATQIKAWCRTGHRRAAVALLYSVSLSAVNAIMCGQNHKGVQ